jgi:hypothetical protein
MGFDLIFGGGKYGIEAAEYLISKNRSFVVVDVDSKCPLLSRFSTEKIRLKNIDKLKYAELKEPEVYFVEGGVYEALRIFEELKPEYVFPTAPIHLSAALVQEKYRFKTWEEGVDFLLSGLPPRIIISAGRGSVVVSYNRDYECQPYCSAPDICPVTEIKKPAPMFRMLGFAARNGFVIQSHQLKPGIGALRGEELEILMKWVEGKNKAFIGTACRCHGVLTALRK